jgi:hypothetical protein
LIQPGKQPLFSADGKLVLMKSIIIEIYANSLQVNIVKQKVIEVILALYKEKGPHLLDEMNGILVLQFTMLIRMNILLLVITWVLFHCILGGISTELLCSL